MTPQKLSRNDLWSLEEYAQRRSEFLQQVVNHKKHRQIAITDNARLYFEDQTTIRFQIQEMLRIERIFEAEGINDELEAYNPLIPDGSNWKATFMLEYPDEEERRDMLTQLRGIEEQVWVSVAGYDKVFAIADEDLDRTTETKTSSVHFLRFELSDSMIASLRTTSELVMGIDNSILENPQVVISAESKQSLIGDLN